MMEQIANHQGGSIPSGNDITRLEKKIDRVILLLTGNGEPERGIIVRLDRLEQWRAAVNKFLSPFFFFLVGQFLLFLIGLLLNRIEVRLP